jgi:hypothetical protein
MDYTMVAATPVLHVASASRIVDSKDSGGIPLGGSAEADSFKT